MPANGGAMSMAANATTPPRAAIVANVKPADANSVEARERAIKDSGWRPAPANGAPPSQ
jgi:hypothetical protein